MSDSNWVEIYQVGLFFFGVFAVIAIVGSFIFYAVSWEEGRSERRSAARVAFATIFGAPVVTLLWPLALIALLIAGAFLLFRDALPGGDR